MTRLVLCCDGTWSKLPDETDGLTPVTNVAKFYSCLQSDGLEQAAYYHPGLGTSGGPISRLAAGAFGRGLGKSILTGYLWLAERYRDGDEIFLFGYSRGAYTVRSLAGMIRLSGLLKFAHESDRERRRQASVAYRRGYRARAPRDEWADSRFQFHHASQTLLPIRFIGVWETVGALGIPNHLSLVNIFDSQLGWRFHDTALGPSVQTARHALAVDERRASFTPTLWRDIEDRDVKQHWFTGSHADVGGGHADDALSNRSLRWMIDEARRHGISFDPRKCERLDSDPNGKIHNSLNGIFLRLRTRPRAVPKLTEESQNVDGTVLERIRAWSPTVVRYRPTRTIGVGEAVDLEIFSHLRWNETGLYLEPGQYVFSARGEWTDGTTHVKPSGSGNTVFRQKRLRYILSALWGYTERAWRAVTGNEAADFWYTRRFEDLPWMALVGVIANDNGNANPDQDGSPRPHESFLIGGGTSRVVNNAGYLYAFANDIWSSYDHNRGSITLNVARIAPGGP